MDTYSTSPELVSMVQVMPASIDARVGIHLGDPYFAFSLCFVHLAYLALPAI